MNVLIVDDSAFMRKWLRELVEDQEGSKSLVSPEMEKWH